MFLHFEQLPTLLCLLFQCPAGEALVGARPWAVWSKEGGPMLGCQGSEGLLGEGCAGLPVTCAHCLQLSFPAGVSMTGLGLMER